MRYYDNLMELLVDREIERQLAQLPAKVIKTINRFEVATYALNRLPPLYASSMEGWRYQKIRGDNHLRNLIATVVRQSFAAIQKDPIRRSTPLKRAEKTEEYAAKMALQKLRDLLNDRELSWQKLAYAVEQAISKTTQLMPYGDVKMSEHEATSLLKQRETVASNKADSSAEESSMRLHTVSRQKSFSSVEGCLPASPNGLATPLRLPRPATVTQNPDAAQPVKADVRLRSLSVGGTLRQTDYTDMNTTSSYRRVSPSPSASAVNVTQELSAHLSKSSENDYWGNGL